MRTVRGIDFDDLTEDDFKAISGSPRVVGGTDPHRSIGESQRVFECAYFPQIFRIRLSATAVYTTVLAIERWPHERL
jgi:hypothetical protein